MVRITRWAMVGAGSSGGGVPVASGSARTTGSSRRRPAWRWRGIESALEQARAVAGERVISVGAASVVQQYLLAGILDELRLNVVAVLLGAGVRLLDNLGGHRYNLERTLVVESEDVTHLRHRVVK